MTTWLVAKVNGAHMLAPIGQGIGLTLHLDEEHAGDVAERVGPGAVVHVHPSAGELPAAWFDAATAAGWVMDRRSPWYLRLGWQGLPGAVTFVLDGLSSGAAGPWDAADAGTVLSALTLAQRALGRRWEATTARTAQGLILDGHPRRYGGRELDRAPEVPAVCLENLEGPFSSWRRPWLDSELDGLVHVFDANAQYLAPWQSCELGLEAVVHEEGGGRPRLDRPGFWRLERLLPEVDGLLPTPWRTGGTPVYSSVTLRYAAELLGGVEALPVAVEGWFWPHQSRYLRGAGERIRDARAQLLELERAEVPGAGLALHAVKGLYRVMVGRFESTRVAASGSPWLRPDWAHLLKATARVNLHRRLSKLAGAAPWAIATDGLVFTSSEPLTGRAFAERIGLPLGDGLGMFAHKGSWRLTPALRDELERARGAVGAMRVLSGHEPITLRSVGAWTS